VLNQAIGFSSRTISTNGLQSKKGTPAGRNPKPPSSRENPNLNPGTDRAGLFLRLKLGVCYRPAASTGRLLTPTGARAVPARSTSLGRGGLEHS
jgi:hypothetical protein